MSLDTMHVLIAVRIGVAAIAGAVIGIERELREQTAGLRTHMLVSVGAAVFAIISVYGFPGPGPRDPSRVAAQIVSGVGFLGAGAIIRQGLTVRGLTTAASLWVVAAIGTAAGVGLYWVTAVASVVSILSLWVLRVIRRRVRGALRQAPQSVQVRLGDRANVDEVLQLLADSGWMVTHVHVEPLDDSVGVGLHVEVTPTASAAKVPPVGALQHVTSVSDVIWERRGT